ncbi:endonuclease Q family protein [Halalkalibacter alkalisediminis]|uniref:Endonuclease Q family protein n=1 Tax=Halalkalibacter alkalisediminis TaxID=935616 RepID=A0ABV6NC42_9BACI|nr:endonuclease Q family protein [Halalkalibacter alkalisediminis]
MIELQDYVADLHIHIGRTRLGAAVKITAAPSLTLKSIIHFAREVKGVDIIGVIDCHVPEVINEIEDDLLSGVAFEKTEGGIEYSGVTLLLGSEIELYDENCHGPIHILAYLPTIVAMREFSEWMARRMKNPSLSSQRIYEKAKVLQRKVRDLKGLFIPAHAFTPFKSLYGKGVKESLAEVFDPHLIDAIELGLSSDTKMADQINELHNYPFLTNSDAHSLEKIAREYQIVRLKDPSFEEVHKALQNTDGRGIKANFGLNPLLGKYYNTICAKCSVTSDTRTCLACGSTKFIKGVSDRLKELASSNMNENQRPPYQHQVPLEFIPKLGKKTLGKLRDHFGTDMNIIHHVTEEQLNRIVTGKISSAILAARQGTLSIKAGGGGMYGKVE